MERLQAARGQLASEADEPVVNVVGAQLLELGCADLRYQVLAGEDAIAVNGAFAEVPGALGEPVADGIGNRVAVGLLARLDPVLPFLDELDQLVLDGRLRPALALDSLASAFPSYPRSIAPV